MKTVLTFGLLFLLGLTTSAAETKKTFAVQEEKNITYISTKEADTKRHKLDLYLPKEAKNYPVLFFIHGGGWRNGSKDGFARHGKAFASQGIGFVAINYRLSPQVKHPGHIVDVAEAFEWVVKNLGKRGANLNQIFVSGHSAGGHLAALLGSDESYLKKHNLSLKNICGVVPVSGVFDVNSERMEALFGESDSRKQASPMTHVRGNLPPFLCLYADKELGALGKQAEAFGKAITNKKGKIEVKMIKDRDHGSIMRNIATADDEGHTLIVKFIQDCCAAKK